MMHWVKPVWAGLGAGLAAGLFMVAVLAGLAGSAGRGLAAQQEINVPQLSGAALAGATLYTRHCAKCHGVVGGWTGKGSTMIHRL